jgi:peptidoglycan-associated lipoprotein
MSRTLCITLASGLLVLMSGCKPDYPKCDKDEHCKDQEYCVNGMCQQCRDTADCAKGEVCNQGRCEQPEGYCETAADCPDQQACKDNRCVPCAADGDCGPNGRCRDGRCLGPNDCITDEDCPENYECQGGSCVAPPITEAAGPCQPEPIYFGFDEFVLSAAATRKLQQAARCINSTSNRSVRVEGHCDPRGTEEYNLALGDRRARSVTNYLGRIGVPAERLRPVSKGKLEATGTNESSWALDRKVLFIWE